MSGTFKVLVGLSRENALHNFLLIAFECKTAFYSEASLQGIHKWTGGGAKLNLSKSPDADVLKAIVSKLQKRVEAEVTDH